MPVIFKDLYKPFKDLQTKEFNGAKSKVTVKGKAADSASFESNVEGCDGKLAGDSSFEFPLNLVVPFRIKSKGASSGDFEVTATFPDLVKDLELEVIHAPTATTATAHYRQLSFNSSVVAKKAKSGVNVEIAGVTKHNSAVVGAKVALVNGGFAGVTGGAHYAGPSYDVGLLVDAKSAKVSWMTKVKDALIGTEVDAPLSGGAPNLAIVAQKPTDGAVVKAKVTTAGTASFAAITKPATGLKLVYAADVKAAGTYNWGVSLTFE